MRPIKIQKVKMKIIKVIIPMKMIQILFSKLFSQALSHKELRFLKKTYASFKFVDVIKITVKLIIKQDLSNITLLRKHLLGLINSKMLFI